jgi:hypothetical protein
MTDMNSRRVFLVAIALVITCALAGCLNPPVIERRVVEDTGTLHLPDIFGSVLRIEGDHGIIYTPDPFPYDGYREGMKVTFTGETSTSPNYPVQSSIPVDLILLRPLPGTTGPVYGIGNITYVDLEGGFYGITVDTRTPSGIITYYPLDLDKEFQVDGITISFTGVEQPGVVTISQWGTPIFLNRVKRII